MKKNSVKVIVFLTLTVCLVSCASMRFSFATPKADPDVYLEYPLSYVLSGKLTGEEAYKSEFDEQDGSFKYFHIVSDAYLNESDSTIYYDNKENSVMVHFSDHFEREYRISDNDNYDPDKLYRIRYTVRWDFSEFYFEIDTIENMLTYDEYGEAENLRKKEDAETAFLAALNASGIEALVQYIKKYRQYEYRDYFNKEAYIETARRLTNNQNIGFHEFYAVSNPYAFEKETVYFSSNLFVKQWLDQAFIACVDGRLREEIYIDEIPNIAAIEEVISRAFLIYKGTATMKYAEGGISILPVFELLYQF